MGLAEQPGPLGLLCPARNPSATAARPPWRASANTIHAITKARASAAMRAASVIQPSKSKTAPLSLAISRCRATPPARMAAPVLAPRRAVQKLITPRPYPQTMSRPVQRSVPRGSVEVAHRFRPAATARSTTKNGVDRSSHPKRPDMTPTSKTRSPARTKPMAIIRDRGRSIWLPTAPATRIGVMARR